MPKSRVSKDLTKTRGPVHGNFEEGARITQGVMGFLGSGSKYVTLTAGQKEAVHMIVHKLHRIVTGNSQHKDHWDDIGGYAQLGADACEGNYKTLVGAAARPSAHAVAVRKARAKAKKKKVLARPAKKKAVAKPRRPRAAKKLARTSTRRNRPAAQVDRPTLVPEHA